MLRCLVWFRSHGFEFRVRVQVLGARLSRMIAGIITRDSLLPACKFRTQPELWRAQSWNTHTSLIFSFVLNKQTQFFNATIFESISWIDYRRRKSDYLHSDNCTHNGVLEPNILLPEWKRGIPPKKLNGQNLTQRYQTQEYVKSTSLSFFKTWAGSRTENWRWKLFWYILGIESYSDQNTQLTDAQDCCNTVS